HPNREAVHALPMFREGYHRRRCIVPVAGFFEWKAIKGQKAKQPYAIAMKDGTPFGLAGIWENWKEPATGEWIRTFAIITTAPRTWSPTSMTACRSYWHRVITPGGLARSLTRLA